MSRALIESCHLAIRKGSHPLRVIIEATSQLTDKKIKSRWSRALEEAAAHDIKPERLSDYLKERGGIAACAAAAAQRKSKKRTTLIWE